jgi:hypothetical protein
MTSRNEDTHALLKRQLEKSIEDLKTVVNDISLMFINERQNHQTNLDVNKIRYSMKLRKSIFQLLTSFVVNVILRKMNSQYQMLIKRSIVMSRCTNVFIIIIGLSCNHRIQKRLYQEESILLEDVHSH